MGDCGHRNMRVVWTKYGSYDNEYLKPQLRNYCDDCGLLVGGALKHSLATADTPHLSQEEASRYEREWRKRAEQFASEEYHRREQWRAEHEAYLQTPEWADRRQLVLKRANGVCEGCGKAPAEQVHHLTYRNWRNEFLWELRAVCRPCHLNVHGLEETNE
jgi:5-methylcytosine-specific restriction endonuclease McrA